MNATTPPAVSIVLPTYNRADLIGRAVRSLLVQTYPDFEILVVDDGSADNTGEVVRQFDDPRIHYTRLERNGGVAAACNHGIRRARGHFVAFQNSDDEWEPDKLARQMAAFGGSAADVAVVYCDMRRILRNGQSTYHRSPDVVRGRWIEPATRFYQTYGIGSQSLLVRREYLADTGLYDERYRCFEDLELLLRVAQRFQLVRLPEPLVRYYETGGLTAMWKAELNARRLILRDHGAAIFAEDRGFVLREACLVVGRTCLGPLARGWVGRPEGPPPA